MPYVIFALKWRPKNFDEIVGQERVATTLKNAIQKNKLANAYLFSGPRGVGKTSTARILAKSLNCKEGPTIRPCEKCPSCLEINQSRSLDVIEIDGASNRGIDEIRALRENVKFAPTQGKYKVYIIDEVHQITPEGFNALLKTLEEPPHFVKFIFATTHPHKVMPTILSRCQRLDFRRISVMEIIAQLEKIAEVEKIDVDKKVLFAIAKASDGSLRDAESILDQLTAFAKDKISFEDVITVLGLVEQEVLFATADKIIDKDAAGALKLINNIIEEGKDISNFLMNLIEHFRNLMIVKVAQADAQLIDLPKELCERLLQQSGEFSLEEIFSVFNTLVNTQEISKRLDSLRIPLEISLVKLTRDKKILTPLQPKVSQNSPAPMHEPKQAIPLAEDEPPHKDDPPHKNDPPAIQAEEKESTQESPEQTQAASLDNVKETWKNIIHNLSSIKISVATYLNEGAPIKLERNILLVSFPKNYSLHKEALERKENKEIIEKAISGLLHANLKVNFVLSKEIAQTNNSEADAFIRSALETFNGRVIKEE